MVENVCSCDDFICMRVLCNWCVSVILVVFGLHDHNFHIGNILEIIANDEGIAEKGSSLSRVSFKLPRLSFKGITSQ